MSQRSRNRNVIQIAVGAACLAGAWYYGQVSSAGQSPDLKTDRPPLKAEDLVWEDQSRVAPPLASASSANLADHVNTAVPELATDRNSSGNGDSTAGLPKGEGPMIVEPDFSGMEKTLEQNLSGNPMASVARNRNTDVASQSAEQFPDASADPQSVLAKSVLPNSNSGSRGLAPVSSRTGPAMGLSADGFRMHVVRPGESLQSLSREYFGIPDYYLDIYVANQDILSSPGSVRNGMSLRIPLSGNE